MSIGFQGDIGSFGEEALIEYFGDVERVNFPTFEALVDKVLSGDVSYGVLPIENSSTGAVKDTYELLKKEDIFIVGEIIRPISHNLLAISGTTVDKIEKIYSHQQALEQSKVFLGALEQVSLIPYQNTASSAKFVSELKDPTVAAVASKRAASCYDLTVLAEDIQYNSQNYTKFVVLKKDMEIQEDANKISLIIEVKHEPGCLFEAVKVFAQHKLNMMKIESRPIIGRPWEYLFYIDFEGKLGSPEVKRAMEDLVQHVQTCKLLGNYKMV